MIAQVNGQPTYCYTGGKPFNPAQPTAVFIHGVLNDHSVWVLQTRYFAHHGWNVLAVDMPGHCRSAGKPAESVEEAARFIVALLDAVGVQKAALVGHSLGSLIALEVAARLAGSDLDIEPTRLAMVGTAFPMKVSPALLDTALAAPEQAMAMVTAFSISTLAAKPANPGPGTWLHGASNALMRRLQTAYAAAGHGNLFHHDFSVCDRYAGALQAAARVHCPVRLLLGARDSMTLPKSAGGLAQALKAEVVTLPAGHALMAEAPDAVLRALADFLR